MITADEIAEIIWQEHARWNGVPAPTPKETWGYKAAERIAARIVAEDQVFDKFCEGDLVRHSGRGAGVIDCIVDGRIRVRFDDGKSLGEYDRNWFRMYPQMLTRI